MARLFRLDRSRLYRTSVDEHLTLTIIELILSLQSVNLRPPTVAMILVARQSVLRAARQQLHPFRPLNPTQASTLARLLSTLAVLEQREGKLNNSSLAAVTAGHQLGGSITGFLAGPKSVAEEAAKVKGIEKVIYVDNSAYDKVGNPLSAVGRKVRS